MRQAAFALLTIGLMALVAAWFSLQRLTELRNLSRRERDWARIEPERRRQVL